MATKKPDLKTFLESPEYQGDRDLFTGLMDDHIAKRAAAEKKRREDAGENDDGTVNIFDWLTGNGGK